MGLVQYSLVIPTSAGNKELGQYQMAKHYLLSWLFAHKILKEKKVLTPTTHLVRFAWYIYTWKFHD